MYRASSQGPECPEPAGIRGILASSLSHGNVIWSQSAVVGGLPFRFSESKDHMETL